MYPHSLPDPRNLSLCQQVYGVPVERLAAQTTANARRFFRLPLPAP